MILSLLKPRRLITATTLVTNFNKQKQGVTPCFCISTGYITIDLTPDNPKFSADLAYEIINSNRLSTLDGIEAVLQNMPEYFSADEVEKMKYLTNAKYDMRIKQYNCGEKQWDTYISIIMVLRGKK